MSPSGRLEAQNVFFIPFEQPYIVLCKVNAVCMSQSVLRNKCDDDGDDDDDIIS